MPVHVCCDVHAVHNYNILWVFYILPLIQFSFQLSIFSHHCFWADMLNEDYPTGPQIRSHFLPGLLHVNIKPHTVTVSAAWNVQGSQLIPHLFQSEPGRKKWKSAKNCLMLYSYLHIMHKKLTARATRSYIKHSILLLLPILYFKMFYLCILLLIIWF